MTIKQAAEKYGITVQAIYSRLKSNGIKLETIKDTNTGELTQDAEIVFDRLFSKEIQEQKESLKSTVERLNNDIKRLESDNAVLIEKLKQLENSNAELKVERERLIGLAERAQELHKAALDRLLPPAAEPPYNAAEGHTTGFKGFFGRIFGK